MPASCDSVVWIYSTLGGDPDLGGLVAEFVAGLTNRQAALCRCRVAEDWSELQRIAHQLKGAAGSYGFDELTESAARLESALLQEPTERNVAPPFAALLECCGRIRAGTPS